MTNNTHYRTILLTDEQYERYKNKCNSYNEENNGNYLETVVNSFIKYRENHLIEGRFEKYLSSLTDNKRRSISLNKKSLTAIKALAKKDKTTERRALYTILVEASLDTFPLETIKSNQLS